MYISEGEREAHLHVIGTTGQGKSKFLEYLLRHDIKRIASGDGRACGLTFIDGSPRGGTIRKVLAYCAEIGFKKVLLIDPFQLRKHGKVTPLKHFNYNPSQIEDSVASMKDVLRVLFGVKDESATSDIARYGYHLFNVLHRAKMTLHDAKWFTNRDSLEHYAKREFIYSKVENDPYARDSVLALRSVFATEHRYERFLSTVGRISVLFESTPLDLMLSSRTGNGFTKLISDGWVVLANVSEPVLGQLQSRLLATIVINNIISTVHRLRDNGFDKPYYLYIDEAGKYATQKIADIVDYHRQSNLRLIISHQFPGQFEDLRIRKSIEINTGTKVAFYIADARERESVIKMLNYGGAITDRDVVFALSSQKKQYMVVRIGKDSPHVIQAVDTPDAQGDVEKFITDLLKNEWYFTPKQILEDNAKRFEGLTQRANPKPSRKGTKANNKPSRPSRVSDKGSDNEAWARVSEDPGKRTSSSKKNGSKRASKKPSD